MFRRSIITMAVTTEAVKQKLLASPVLKAVDVGVEDASGGCGSFFNVKVVSPVFKGQSLVMQHRMINECLKEEIAELHGLTIKTALPPGDG